MIAIPRLRRWSRNDQGQMRSIATRLSYVAARSILIPILCLNEHQWAFISFACTYTQPIKTSWPMRSSVDHHPRPKRPPYHAIHHPRLQVVCKPKASTRAQRPASRRAKHLRPRPSWRPLVLARSEQHRQRQHLEVMAGQTCPSLRPRRQCRQVQARRQFEQRHRQPQRLAHR